MASSELKPIVASLLAKAGRKVNDLDMKHMVAGGNNRVFEVLVDGQRFVAKKYFYAASDRRDRLGTEFKFLSHIWEIGLRCVPEPLVYDDDSRVALYEFIEGRRLECREIDESFITETARFFAALNDVKSRTRGYQLSNASEACFTVASHLDLVDCRLARLGAISPSTQLDREAIEFTRRLSQVWELKKAEIRERCDERWELPGSWRCLSPSDFGFHNTLLRTDGKLCFLDFEYAGWDDPAKVMGDFFSHPGSPVPQKYYEAFLNTALAPFAEREALAERSRLLAPVFRVKWCCIILNEFLPEDARRRRFADPTIGAEARKKEQLAKAWNHLEKLT
ncbi:MAG TPA: aminoglycoside phosphotransferase family protein [Chryseosolibacter sp.]|nr:aminoglycoside phosphotransferase family protein [Chryseosolibacter sp.]